MERRLELAKLHGNYEPPTGLRVSRPREVTLSIGGRFLLGLVLLLFAGAITAATMMTVQILRREADNRIIASTGIDAVGTIVRLARRSDEKKAGTVAYRFDVNGREFRGQTDVSLSTWRTLQVGAPFRVTYSAWNPDLSVMQGARLDTMPRWLPFVVGGAFAALGLICLVAIQRQRELLSDGRIAPAQVIKHSRQGTSHGGKHRSMTYEFTVLSGAMVSGKAPTSSKPPAIGSVICVIYDPEHPGRNRPYPFELVRPA